MSKGYMPKRKSLKTKKWKTGVNIEVGDGKHVHEIPQGEYSEEKTEKKLKK